MITRRGFLKQSTAAAGFPLIASSLARAAQGNTAPSDRITVGLIGKGVMGNGHLRRLVGDKGVQVVGVCDVDRLRCQQAKQVVENAYSADRKPAGYNGCEMYNDYRKLIARTDLDAVVIVTPDHWHALQSIDAIKAGKDVYCEKPVSLTVEEGRQLVKAVHRYGRVFQTGTQYRSISTIRRVVDYVRGGGIGKVKQAFTLWRNMGGFLNARRFDPCADIIRTEKNKNSYIPLDVSLPGEAVPDGLDWDMWVGPAKWRPYNQAFHLNPTPGVVPWSFCGDFGAAAVTWYHSHAADVIQYALGMENSGPVEFIPPGVGKYPTMTCRYANGTLLHLVDQWEMVKDVYKAVPSGARLAGNFGGVFVGENGWVTSMTTGGQIEGGPDSLFEDMKLKTRNVNPGDNDHHANWFECIRTRQKPSCSEEIGHRGVDYWEI